MNYSIEKELVDNIFLHLNDVLITSQLCNGNAGVKIIKSDTIY